MLKPLFTRFLPSVFRSSASDSDESYPSAGRARTKDGVYELNGKRRYADIESCNTIVVGRGGSVVSLDTPNSVENTEEKKKEGVFVTKTVEVKNWPFSGQQHGTQ